MAVERDRSHCLSCFSKLRIVIEDHADRLPQRLNPLGRDEITLRLKWQTFLLRECIRSVRAKEHVPACEQERLCRKHRILDLSHTRHGTRGAGVSAHNGGIHFDGFRRSKNSASASIKFRFVFKGHNRRRCRINRAAVLQQHRLARA